MIRVRAYRPGDDEQLGPVCIRTGMNGGDATGSTLDDTLLPVNYIWPYPAFDPSLTWVVADGNDNAIGYITAASDSDAFYRWFASEWWPLWRSHFATLIYRTGQGSSNDPALVRTQQLFHRAENIIDEGQPYDAGYPAHLHIDLLPAAQAQGLGRRLIKLATAELRTRGVAGVHLGVSPDNSGAIRFYERIGMTRLAGPGHLYGLRLR